MESGTSKHRIRMRTVVELRRAGVHICWRFDCSGASLPELHFHMVEHHFLTSELSPVSASGQFSICILVVWEARSHLGQWNALNKAETRSANSGKTQSMLSPPAYSALRVLFMDTSLPQISDWRFTGWYRYRVQTLA